MTDSAAYRRGTGRDGQPVLKKILVIFNTLPEPFNQLVARGSHV